jgi:hypothetical protein
MDQVVPSQLSIRVVESFPVPSPPTATQLLELAHETSLNPLPPVWEGLETTDQFVPSQLSTRV